MVPGSYIKIAYFTSEADIEYQDEVHGALLIQPDKIMDLLYTKYLKAKISYEGITRVEKYPYPKEAVREALLNAIAHKDYAKLTPIQIRVYYDRLVISNDCVFLDDWTLDDLLVQHKSRPYNPLIANTFYRAGFVESWGRGIQKISESCAEHNCAAPEYQVKKEDFGIIFFPAKDTIESNETGEKSNEYDAASNESEKNDELIKEMDSISEKELSKKDKERLLIIIKKNNRGERINGTMIASLLNVSEQIARRLLRKAEKLGLIESEGKTNGKKYYF